MNPELARQRAEILAVRERIASRPAAPPCPAPREIRRVEPTHRDVLGPPPAARVVYPSPHYDHVRVWRRVERARRDKGPRVEDVLDAAREVWGTTREHLLSRVDQKRWSSRRAVVAYLAMTRCKGVSSLDAAARLARDHTVVLRSLRLVRERLTAGDAEMRRLTADVLSYLGLRA